MTGPRIGKEYYDQKYFEAGAAHLQDLDSPFQRYRVSKVLDLYPAVPTDRVVDLGCGWGTFCFALASRVASVKGVDFSEQSIEICRRRLAESGATNIEFLRADAGDTGLEGGAFDLVIAADLFEHLYPDDSDRVMAEAYRLLRKGGRFSIWTPHRGHILEILKNNRVLLKPDPSHVDYKSMERLVGSLEGHRFRVERAYYAESHLPVLRTVERALQKVLPILRRRIAVLAVKI